MFNKSFVRAIVIVLFCVLALASAGHNDPSFAQGDATIQVVPAVDTIVPVGETGIVDIHVDDVIDLFSVDIIVKFDPGILQVVDANPFMEDTQVDPGDFLDITEGKGFFVENTADNNTGTIVYAATLLSPEPPVSGSGVLISIEFEGLAEGEDDIILYSVLLSDLEAEAIPAEKVNGIITVTVGE